MELDKQSRSSLSVPRSDSGEQCLDDGTYEIRSNLDDVRCWSLWIASRLGDPLPDQGLQPAFGMRGENQEDPAIESESSPINLAEFVRLKFVPEYVSSRRLAGRAHFQSILKHILTPQQVAHAFEADPNRIAKPRSIPGWPYLVSLRLVQIDRESVQHLISTALTMGYSTQIATHIRNVVRSIFAHAIRTRCFSDKNPAAIVSLPAMKRKELHALTLSQIRHMMQMMRYPEKVIATIVTITGMNVAEVCGLQWKYVNLSNDRHLADADWIPPRTICVRKQSYRGEFGPVIESRKRVVPIPEVLFSILRELKNRENFTGLQDFVLASQRYSNFS